MLSEHAVKKKVEKYRSNSKLEYLLSINFKKLATGDIQEYIYKSLSNMPMEDAIETPWDKFKSLKDFSTTIYTKPAIWAMLETTVGRKKIDEAFKNYFEKWKFKDTTPEDMKQSFEESIGGKLNSFFDLLNKTEKLE